MTRRVPHATVGESYSPWRDSRTPDLRHHHRRHHRRHHRSSHGAGLPARGSVSIQMAILMPVALLVLLTAVQAMVYFQARSAAIAAAEAGARVAGLRGSSLAAGLQSARDVIANSPTHLGDMQLQGTRGATAATIRLTGRASGIVPGIDWTVDVTARAPVETQT